eukprot:748566-Hanusia_phi.AAC.1
MAKEFAIEADETVGRKIGNISTNKQKARERQQQLRFSHSKFPHSYMNSDDLVFLTPSTKASENS